MGREMLLRTTGKTAAALALAFAMLAGGALPAKAADNEALPKVIEKTTPSVVAIIGKPSGSGSDEWKQDRFSLAHGTGVIVKSEGVIITNAHVVKDMTNLIVVTSDGKSYPGRTTNVDEESDLALVKIDASDLPAATLADSGDLKVGETVAAIGTPISFALRNSVTVGVVSGIDRSISSEYQLIQTDAAINPGNSGGALVNMRGEVVGINTMKVARYGVENLGFAIPIDTVKYVLDHFAKYGKVKRPYLGIELEESWEAVVGLPSENGLRVAYVDPESPAGKAGIKEGDQLLAIGGAHVSTMAAYHESLKKYLPDDTVTLTLQSGSSQISKEVKLGEDTTVHGELTQDTGSANIDADHGKSFIGDSHFGWSMKYPAGLMKNTQNSDGTNVAFEDSNGEFSLDIQVEDLSGSELSIAGLFDKMDGTLADTVLEKQYVRHKGVSYAKLAAKSPGGSFYQSRAYQQGGNLYILTLTVHGEATYSNKFKLNSLYDLLDSFQLSFDKNDGALKDISVLKTGGNRVHNDYGLSLELPADWNTGDREQGSFFTSEDYKRYAAMAVTSVSPEDTLDAWLGRSIKAFEDNYADNYRKTGEAKNITVSGVPAKMIETSWTMGGTWSSNTSILFIKDKYKYEIELGYPQDEDGKEAFVKGIVDSVKLDKAGMNPALGFIQDVQELIDPGKTVKYHSGKYKYTVSVPETWHAKNAGYRDDKDPQSVIYGFKGGSFSVRADAGGKLSDTVKDKENYYKKNAGNDSEYKYTESDETVFDAAGKKFELQYTTNKVPFRSTEYVFEKNKIVYTVTLRLNDAARTDHNVTQLNAAFQSLQFNP